MVRPVTAPVFPPATNENPAEAVYDRDWHGGVMPASEHTSVAADTPGTIAPPPDGHIHEKVSARVSDREPAPGHVEPQRTVPEASLRVDPQGALARSPNIENYLHDREGSAEETRVKAAPMTHAHMAIPAIPLTAVVTGPKPEVSAPAVKGEVRMPGIPVIGNNATPEATDRAAVSNVRVQKIKPAIPIANHAQSKVAEKAASLNTAAAGPERPEINVVIGRIEVRAITREPPPAKRPARQEPKLSLEEYARLRRRGKI